MSFPRDLFKVNEDRYILIMCLMGDTNGTFGYYHRQEDEEEAIEHYNNIKKFMSEDKVKGVRKDEVLYLEGCKIVRNPVISKVELPDYLTKELSTVSEEELENVIKFSMAEIKKRKIKKFNKDISAEDVETVDILAN